MENRKPRYGTIPIMLLRNIHTDHAKTIREMFYYAIYDRIRKTYPYREHEDLETDLVDEARLYFRINPNPSQAGATLIIGKELYDTFHGTPNASVNINRLWQYYEEKTEYELMVFSFYVAIRSIVGTKAFWKGTDNFWLARAFGYSSVKEYENSNPTQSEKDLRVKYSNRYWLELVKKTLQNDWYLVYVSTNKHFKVKGFYVSLKLSYEKLVSIAKEKNCKYKSKQIARDEVLARVCTGTKPIETKVAIPKGFNKGIDREVPF